MLNSVNELYDIQAKIWKEENEKYFGISPLNDWNNEEVVKKHLDNCADKFWNNGTNELKELFKKGKCKDYDKLVPGSFELVFDSLNSIICLYATFEFESENKKTGEKVMTTKRAPLSYLPYLNDLCWFLNGSEYVLRIFANINYSLYYRKDNNIIYQRTWVFDTENKSFDIKVEDFDPYENLTNLNRIFLKACYGQEITKENFKDALCSIPEIENNSLLNFKFGHVDEIFKLISFSKRFANPLMKVSIPINVVKMFTAQKSREDQTENGNFSNLVLSTNKLFALENSRTVIYKSMYNGSFSFDNSDKVFDAFKTSTNKSAGRSRLLLDEAYVKDGMIFNNVNGTCYNMYELILNDINLPNNLSVLSSSRFSSSNDAKRLMMTAKLRAQAIPTLGETNSFTHETPARVVFGDFEGFNYGDAIIISRSFAQKLETTYSKKITFNSYEDYKDFKSKYSVGDFISVDDLYEITKSNMYANYREIELLSLDRYSFSITAKAPFSVGDKITNLHGSKGIVSLILEDEQMPFLKNDIISENGEVFPAGPFDIIISALSVFRRKTSGQLFEAWALATKHNDVDNIQDAVAKYSDELKNFSNQSIICWNGEEVIKPCGINMIIRLNHDAVTKQSFSYLKSNYAKMLKMGEMELLNLASRGLYDIINEIDIRSVNKHYNSFPEIKQMQKTGEAVFEPSDNLRFLHILKDIGFDFNLRDYIKDSAEFEETYMSSLIRNLLTDNQIELFD